MNIIQRVNQIPLSRFLTFTLIAGFLLVLPLSIYLVQQQTRLPSSAAPEPTPVKKIVPYGPVPDQPPKVRLITPFIGKVGDLVVIKGRNLGENPKDRKIIFAGVIAQESDIMSWQDDQIQVVVPQGAGSGLIKIIIGPWRTTWGIPFIVYNRQTRLKLSYTNKRLRFSELPARADQVFVWPVIGEKVATQAALIGTLRLDKPPVAVALYDTTGKLIPFYVDPIEFGFSL